MPNTRKKTHIDSKDNYVYKWYIVYFSLQEDIVIYSMSAKYGYILLSYVSIASCFTDHVSVIL